ncbi:hypothetical protein Acr_00g0098880 [Actinidia rufa]|uniref:Uncharacterized protein n=1 Tax=Actinidia rufa TaxID=165716 RepID=A0A7J0DZD3_9ERIC|nr:hypothetical protein Acr_00g0098880 [Actinidia rufa]
MECDKTGLELDRQKIGFAVWEFDHGIVKKAGVELGNEAQEERMSALGEEGNSLSYSLPRHIEGDFEAAAIEDYDSAAIEDYDPAAIEDFDSAGAREEGGDCEAGCGTTKWCLVSGRGSGHVDQPSWDYSGRQLWMFGAHIMDYPDTRDLFMAMPNDELRFRWLEERRRIYALSLTARPLSTNSSLFKSLPTSS